MWYTNRQMTARLEDQTISLLSPNLVKKCNYFNHKKCNYFKFSFQSIPECNSRKLFTVR